MLKPTLGALKTLYVIFSDKFGIKSIYFQTLCVLFIMIYSILRVIVYLLLF